ncbi:signal peptidase I [Chloroflexota bacterium]
MKAFLREILEILVIAAVIFFGLQFVVKDYIILEYCMEPNLQEGQRIFVNKIVYNFHEPERGDVIVFQPPTPYGRKADPFIKRIIALPGETVEVTSGAVYINGSKLHEPYIKEPPNYSYHSYQLPEDNYFVLGDNRNNANDSHTGWTLPRQNIIGKAWLSIWPPDKWGLVTHYPAQEQLANSMI